MLDASATHLPAASEEPANPDPLHLSRILHEMAGAVSLCWEPWPSGVFESSMACGYVAAAIAEIRSRMTATAQPAPTSRLKWMEAPRRSEWGAGMMEALAALGPDETLRLYAHRDAVPMADALLSAQPAPARVPLTEEQVVMDAIMMMPTSIANDCAKACEYGIRYAERAHGITAPGAPDAAPNAELTGAVRRPVE